MSCSEGILVAWNSCIYHTCTKYLHTSYMRVVCVHQVHIFSSIRKRSLQETKTDLVKTSQLEVHMQHACMHITIALQAFIIIIEIFWQLLRQFTIFPLRQTLWRAVSPELLSCAILLQRATSSAVSTDTSQS